MIKFVCVFALLAVSCLALPVEEHAKLSRPSPINPDVASDPKPTELKEVGTSSSTTESHIQKVPATGVKLSIEVAKKEETTTSSSTTEQTTKNNPKRSVDSDGATTTTKQPAFRRNQPSTTTEQPSSTTASSTTSSPVSVKTPIGTTRAKREVEVTAIPASSAAGTAPTKRTTTIAPNSNDDAEGPHFVRPVPVDQILKNLSQSDKTTSASGASEQHKTQKSNDERKESDESSEEDDAHKPEGTEQKAHQQTHPVIRQQGA